MSMSSQGAKLPDLKKTQPLCQNVPWQAKIHSKQDRNQCCNLSTASSSNEEYQYIYIYIYICWSKIARFMEAKGIVKIDGVPTKVTIQHLQTPWMKQHCEDTKLLDQTSLNTNHT